MMPIIRGDVTRLKSLIAGLIPIFRTITHRFCDFMNQSGILVEIACGGVETWL